MVDKRVKAIVVAILGLVLLVGPLQAGPAAADDKKLPVPYQFLPGAVLGGIPGANSPGTNDWSCKPTKRHPRPVVLVHGLLGNRSTNWPTYGPLLKNNGYCVFALTYGVEYDLPVVNLFGGLNDMRSSARELKRFVAKVKKATGARKVDLVGHSEGTIVPQWYIKFLGGKKHVKRFVGIASAFKGTNIPTPFYALLGQILPGGELPTVCVSCLQFAPASPFMKKLHEGGMLAKGVDYTSIVTKYDELVLPYTNGTMKGVRNIVLQDVCKEDWSEHFQIVSSRNVAQIVLNRLDPKRKKPITCHTVLPFVGELAPGLP